MLSDTRLTQPVDSSAASAITLAAAPGAGKHIEIDHMELLPSGGANTLTFTGLSDGAGTAKTLVYVLSSGQGYTYDKSADEASTFVCLDNTALTLTPSSANRLTGAVNYRIV